MDVNEFKIDYDQQYIDNKKDEDRINQIKMKIVKEIGQVNNAKNNISFVFS